MNNRESAACQGFVDYMAGEMTDVERKRFERHLDTCPVCREDAAEWSYVWQRLSEEAPLLEPPADLRNETLEAAFAEEAVEGRPPEPRANEAAGHHAGSWVRTPTLRRLYVAVALLAVFCAGFISRPLLTAPERPDVQAAEAPSQIERLVRLAPAANALSDEAAKYASGVACLLRSAEEQRLVVYVFGTLKTEGSEAYHVWLLKDGKRTSAGTFTVGESGIGLLSIPWSESAPSFDQVGITLEPNADSTEPMGPKMFGSV